MGIVAAIIDGKMKDERRHGIARLRERDGARAGLVLPAGVKDPR